MIDQSIPSAQSLYTVDFGGAYQLHNISLNNPGVARVLANTNGGASGSNIVMDPSTRTLYLENLNDQLFKYNMMDPTFTGVSVNGATTVCGGRRKSARRVFGS